jgi:hypothetical protein
MAELYHLASKDTKIYLPFVVRIQNNAPLDDALYFADVLPEYVRRVDDA